MFNLLVPSRFMGATAAIVVGISSSMALGAALLAPLKVRSTCKLAGTAIFFVTAILKVTVIISTRERCEWDSGLKSVPLTTTVPTQAQTGGRCPGSSLKKLLKVSSKHVKRDELAFLEKNFGIAGFHMTLLNFKLQNY